MKQLFSLQDKYCKQFENEVTIEFYKKCKDCLKEYNEETLYNDLADIMSAFEGVIDTLKITNDFIEFLYGEWPITSFSSIKNSLECYIEEKISISWCKEPEYTSDYNLYRQNRIEMEVLYRAFSKYKVSLSKYDRVIHIIEAKLNEELREVSEIIIDNKVYKFGIFYEATGFNFWRLNNTASLYEKLSIEFNDYSSDYPYNLLNEDTPCIRAYLNINDTDYKINIS